MSLDIVFKEERELTKNEYMNLTTKANAGALPVEYFRKNIFNATTRVSKELKRYKTIFDNGNEIVQVSRSLHQKHRDVLSILYTDNLGITKPNADGSYTIRTNLYYIAKEMGYKNPKDATHLIKDFLFDLRYTEMFYKKRNTSEEVGHSILGDYRYNHDTGEYNVTITAMAAKMQIVKYAVEIPKELNRRIIAIPNNLAKIKALVGYILSNQALKNGISFNSICEKLDIEIGADRSRFRKQVRENTDLLETFNIFYLQDKFTYEQIDSVKFQRGIEPEEVLKTIKSDSTEKDKERYGFDKNFIIGKYLEHKTKSVLGTDEIVRSKIVDVEMRENGLEKEFSLVIENRGRLNFMPLPVFKQTVERFVKDNSQEQEAILSL